LVFASQPFRKKMNLETRKPRKESKQIPKIKNSWIPGFQIELEFTYR